MSADGSLAIVPLDKRPYSAPELALIREHYPRAGAAATLALLPGRRSLAGVRKAASRIGVHAPGIKREGRSLYKYLPDPFTDAEIRRAFDAHKPPKNWMAQLVQRIARPDWWIRARAIDLGYIRRRRAEREWSEREQDILTTCAHLSPVRIAYHLRREGFHRAPGAIRTRLVKQHISLRQARVDAGLLSAAQVAQGLGVEGSTVSRWCRQGLLIAKRRGTRRETTEFGGDEWAINTTNLRVFIAQNPERLNLARVDRDWFIHLLTSH